MMETLDNGAVYYEITSNFEGLPLFFEEFKTYLGAYKVRSIFKQNLQNIKRIIETGK